MLFKFKSKASSDLIMLEPDARRLLKIMLGTDEPKGIVLTQDLPAVISALEQAVFIDEAERKTRSEHVQASVTEDTEPVPPTESVALSQRAAPMLKLLKRSVAEKSNMVWGV